MANEMKAEHVALAGMQREAIGEAAQWRCHTGNPGCEGLAYFGPYEADTGWTIWWQNGNQGSLNFALRAGETHQVNVRYGDTCSGTWGYQAPPPDAQRNWIWVS